jgi:phospholipase/carboxylesterase
MLAAGTTLAGQSVERSDHVPNPDTLWYHAPAFFRVMIELPEDFDSERTYPAVVALHGFGSSYASFRSVAAALTDAGFIAILPEAPYLFQSSDVDGQYSWGLNSWTPPPLTDDPGLDRRSTELTVTDFIPKAVERVRERYNLGPVYVFGFSQGAVYAFLTGFYNHDKFSGIIAFGMGGFSRDWATVQGGVLEDANHLPVLLGLGRSDPMVPYEDAERARDLLSEAGYRVTLNDFPGGHSLPSAELTRAVQWLLEVHRRR